MTDTVKISQTEYRKMQRNLAKLAALEAGGVDNWEWYGDSLSEWNKENDLEELADDFVDAINDISVDADVDYPAGREAGPSVTMPEDAVRALFLSFIEKYKEL